MDTNCLSNLHKKVLSEKHKWSTVPPTLPTQVPFQKNIGTDEGVVSEVKCMVRKLSMSPLCCEIITIQFTHKVHTFTLHLGSP